MRPLPLRPLSRVLAACIILIACSPQEGAPGSLASETSDLAAQRERPGAFQHRVVVAGAGLAGLTAALDLRDQGWDVIVVEARDRVGGRVHTLRAPLTAGMHAELGGESIDDDHNAIQDLAQRYGLSLEHRPLDKVATGTAYFHGQRSVIADFLADSQGQVAADYASLADALAELSQGLDPEHPELFADARALDRRSLGDFITEQQLLPAATFALRAVNQAGYNADLSEVSLLFAAQQTAASDGASDDGSETMRIAGGNDALPAAMAADLSASVRLRSPVTGVQQLPDRVRIKAGAQLIDAAYLVLAVPMQPLRQVSFDPPLPHELQAAVRDLKLGPALKVVSEYAHSFWKDEGLSGLTISELPFGIAWSSSDSYESERGLLTQFITGSAARQLAQLSSAVRISACLRQLDVVYPEGARQRTGHNATMSWLDERYTGGGYAVYAPGQLTRFWPAIRQGTARIRFAGEHTEALAGFMESAVRSGHRVAKELGKPD